MTDPGFVWQGQIRWGGTLVISYKCQLICWLIWAPMLPTHFLHKTFPGTTNKTSHCAKFHNSSCLISWLTKTDLCETTECSPPLKGTRINIMFICFWNLLNKLYAAFTEHIKLNLYDEQCKLGTQPLFKISYSDYKGKTNKARIKKGKLTIKTDKARIITLKARIKTSTARIKTNTGKQTSQIIPVISFKFLVLFN